MGIIQTRILHPSKTNYRSAYLHRKALQISAIAGSENGEKCDYPKVATAKLRFKYNAKKRNLLRLFRAVKGSQGLTLHLTARGLRFAHFPKTKLENNDKDFYGTIQPPCV